MKKWLRRFQSEEPARARLVCFPHAGGSANYFRSWRQLLPGDLELVAVQYPGRQDRYDEAPYEEMDALVSAMLGSLESLGDLPAVFFGHSMGSTVGFEAVRRLSWSPKILVVSARPGPSRHRPPRQRVDRDEELLARLERLGGLQVEVLADPELRELVMPALRADYRAIHTYRPELGATVDVDVLGLVGDADPEVSIEDVQAWSESTTGQFSMGILPGDHFYLNDRSAQVLDRLFRAAWDDEGRSA